MSSSYSANQYEGAFKSQKLQNWTIPKRFKERPSAAEGYTTFIATDRGHLLPGLRRKQQSPWPAFQGTWDLPNHIPPVSLNLTARSQEGQDRLRRWGQINISRKHGASGGAGAFIRSPHDLVEANVEQALEHPCDQDKPERSTSQQSQNQPIPTEEKQCMSRASQKAPSRPATQENQGQLRPATQNCRTTSQPK